jgi:hypothetical protein
MNFLNELCEMWFIRNGERRSEKVYRAKVVDNKDPLGQNRVKVYIPELMKRVSGIWARPSYHFKKQAITPQVGDVVLVTFENGNLQLPIYVGHVRLACPQDKTKDYCGYIQEKETDPQNVPQDFWLLETPDNRRFRANDYRKQIQIESFNTKRIVEIDDQHKYIEIRSETTSRRIKIDDENGKIIIETPKGKIEIDDNEPHIDATIGQSQVHMTPSSVDVKCGSSNIHIDGNQIRAKSSVIFLN